MPYDKNITQKDLLLDFDYKIQEGPPKVSRFLEKLNNFLNF